MKFLKLYNHLLIFFGLVVGLYSMMGTSYGLDYSSLINQYQKTGQDQYKQASEFVGNLYPDELKAYKGLANAAISRLGSSATALEIAQTQLDLAASFQKSEAGRQYAAFMFQFLKSISEMTEEQEKSLKDQIKDMKKNMDYEKYMNMYQKILNKAKLLIS